jgi:hypothetical protein
MYIEFWWGQSIHSLGQPLLRTFGQSYYNTVQVGVAATSKICTGISAAIRAILPEHFRGSPEFFQGTLAG